MIIIHKLLDLLQVREGKLIIVVRKRLEPVFQVKK